MHSHQGLQEQLLLNAPLIIRDQRDRPGEQEIVLMLGDFSGRDGTPFSLRVVKPKSVEVKGTGADGKTYEVSIPWR